MFITLDGQHEAEGPVHVVDPYHDLKQQFTLLHKQLCRQGTSRRRLLPDYTTHRYTGFQADSLVRYLVSKAAVPEITDSVKN